MGSFSFIALVGRCFKFTNVGRATLNSVHAHFAMGSPSVGRATESSSYGSDSLSVAEVSPSSVPSSHVRSPAAHPGGMLTKYLVDSLFESVTYSV